MRKLKAVLVVIATILFCVSICATAALAQEKAKPSPPPAVPKAEKPAEPEKALVGDLGVGGKVGKALAKTPAGTGKGEIDVTKPKGFFGIPGAPSPNPIFGLLWAIWVGWIFSTVGAFGGIMAGIGHITIFGIGPYAKTFRETNMPLNKILTDSIRASNQFLVWLAAFISTINFIKMRRLALPLGIALGLGSLVGALVIPWATAGKISLKAYIGWFGLIVFVIGGFLIWETSPKGQASKKKAKEAGAAFAKAMKEKEAVGERGIKLTKFGLGKITMTWFGQEFSFNPLLAFIGGVLIASLSTFIGVGGGFLYVPYGTSVVGLPMFVVAGTSALAVFLAMVMSIFTFVVIKGTPIAWSFIGMELIGIFIGAMLGPRTQKYIPDVWLKRLFIVLALYVGLRYASEGFLGYKVVP